MAGASTWWLGAWAGLAGGAWSEIKLSGYVKRAPELYNSFSFPPIRSPANLTPRRNHGPLPGEDFNIVYQARKWPRQETESDHRLAIEAPWISCTPEQPQYEFYHQFFGLNVKRRPVPSVLAVFELPDELILSVLSHISPDPQFTGHYARFRVQYCMDTNDHHKQRVRFLLPLSMTCRTMRSRLLPWIWERIESPGFGPGWKPQGGIPKGFNTLIGALRTDTILAANVKYFHALSCTLVRPDLSLQVLDGVHHVG